MRRERREAGEKGEKASNSLVQAEGEKESGVLIHSGTNNFNRKKELARKLWKWNYAGS